MSGALQLGPLLLPFPLLLVVASALIALALGRWLGREAAADAERAVWRALMVGLVLSRLGFVYEYRSLYLGAPLSIIDIRDGGWNLPVGLAGAWLYALHAARRSPSLRRPLYGALAAGTALLVGGTSLLALRGPQGPALPDLTFASLEGERVRLRDFEGRPTVVNLWATWCPPCRREMPVLQQAQAERPEVNFVFLNQGEAAAHVRGWLQSEGLTLKNVLLDPPRQASAYFRQQGYPTTLFFDRQGRLVAVRVGELSAATLAQRLGRLSP
ncbi:MAG: TlpA disulfide reductase family protein [Pseudomonadota bacterium]|uniref:TlpA family protein disulfide reductase n=1 Tax=Caldimonas aquatica TaxID=376175 RepID=A0ABY6MRJ9_9BURK|nr:TlpA disulfide reductase family protein [Schlegelella aquatica]UZD54632.1 TlpA family protein disulfide reductase [Schlegelella aquatica]